MSEHYLSPLFLPTSVALVGATEREGALGRFVFLNLQSGGFRNKGSEGVIYAVNPKHDQVFGQPCFARLSDLPATPDLIVIATPAAGVGNILQEAGVAGVRAALILSAGFAETGAEGQVRAHAVEAIARRYGIRMIGPNCIGMMRPAIGLNATFANAGVRAGSLALVSQSGAVCTAILDWAATTEIGFSSVISLGGALDVDSLLQAYRNKSGNLVVVYTDTSDISAEGFAASVQMRYGSPATDGYYSFILLMSRKNSLLFASVNSHTLPFVNDQLLLGLLEPGFQSLKEKRRAEGVTRICMKAIEFLEQLPKKQ